MDTTVIVLVSLAAGIFAGAWIEARYGSNASRAIASLHDKVDEIKATLSAK